MKGAEMSANKDLVLNYVDAFNRGDLDTLCALFTREALIFGVIGAGSVDVARPIWRDLIDCLAIHLHVESLIAEDDLVAARFTESGKSIKLFRGEPATGKTYQIPAMEFFEIQNQKIHRRWGARDSAAMNRQLGFPPS
jgi:steroid delta-isomerase-like uncharacterized protein